MAIRAGKTKRASAQRAIDSLGRVSSPLVGLVMTDVGHESVSYYYYAYGDSATSYGY